MIARKATSALSGAGALVLVLVAALESIGSHPIAVLWWLLAIGVGVGSYYLWPPEPG